MVVPVWVVFILVPIFECPKNVWEPSYMMNVLECLKNVSEHAKIYWKHVLEYSKIVLEKVEKGCKKLKNVFKTRIWCTKIMN